MKLIMTVSTTWLSTVDPVARSHRCFERVSAFQNWKTWMSRNCPIKYAIIDAMKSCELPPKIFAYSAWLK